MAESHLESIPVELLVIEDEYRAREADDPDHVLRLSQSAPQEWPSLIVCKREDGKYTVLDGCHRLAASAHFDNGENGRTLRAERLPCRVVELAEGESEYEAAVMANLDARGLQLSRADRKVFSVWLHENYPDLSARAISRRVGLNVGTVIAALKAREGQPAGAKAPQLPKFLNFLVKAGNEGSGFLKDRRAYVERCILDAKDPAVVVTALDAWLDPLAEGLEWAKAKLAERE